MTAVAEPQIDCLDRLLQRCKGVAASTEDGQALGVALSLALEALDICIGKHDELAVCVEEFQAKQAERRKRLEGKQ